MLGAARNPANLANTGRCLSWGRPTWNALTGSDVTTLYDHAGNTLVEPATFDPATYDATGLSGKPCFETDGVSRAMVSSTSTVAAAMAAGEDLPFWCVLALQYTGSLTPATYAPRPWALGGGSGNLGFFSLNVAQTTGFFQCSKRAETGGTSIITSATQWDNNPRVLSLTMTAGNVATLYDTDMSVLVTGTLNVGTMNIIYANFGGCFVGSDQLFAACKYGAYAMGSGEPTLTELTRIVRNIRNDSGI